VLSAVLDECFEAAPHAPRSVGIMLAAQWQGALLWRSFDPAEPVERYVEKTPKRFVAVIAEPTVS